jgi:ATP-dependent RNA helicase HelY
VLREADLQAGDFVRWTKQVVDLLDQITQVGEGKTARTAQLAIDAIRRGVVAYSSVGA